MMEIGEIKKNEKIRNLKDDKVVILGSMGDNFQYELIKVFCIMIKSMIKILQKFCH